MKKVLLLIISICFSAILNAQSIGKPYAVYSNKGKEVEFEKMTRQLSKNDVILFGELHNNSMVHWLQLQLLKSLKSMETNLTLGAEMFEADDQLKIDEYLTGYIKQSNFEKEAKLWNNYATDYKPLMEFAKENNCNFIATNVPRRYASIVASKGLEYLDSLPASSKQYMAPLPISFGLEVPGYEEMITMMGGHGAHGSSMNIVKAQALKDATMAHFIANNLERKKVFVHFNGDFHSKQYGGIYWYLQNQNDIKSIGSISVVEAENLDYQEDYAELGDFILVIPSDMTKTY